MKLLNNYLLIIFCLLFIACGKDDPGDQDTGLVSGPNGVYITNEGNFQAGNASVSYFADNRTEAVEDLFKTANNRPLGDVCQSMRIINNKAYLVINGSAKIEVVDPLTFVSSATITGFHSPNYIFPVNNSKAYVSDLYAKYITVVDLATKMISAKIPFASGTIDPVMVNNKIYMPAQSSDHLFVLDPGTDKVTDSIKIDFGASSIKEDKNGKIWVLCSGHFGPGEYFLHCIDPVNNTVLKSYNFPNAGDSPWRLNINKTRDTLYYLNKGVNRMAINDATLPADPFIKQENRNFYGLAINPNNGNIYVSDALDFVQRGRVEIYHPDGKLYKNFLAGIIPGGFYFR